MQKTETGGGDVFDDHTEWVHACVNGGTKFICFFFLLYPKLNSASFCECILENSDERNYMVCS